MVEYVGLDVSKEETSYCVMDCGGAVMTRGKVMSDPDGIFAVLREHCLCPERIVLETGRQSHWLARGLRDRGLRVVQIDARQAHGVMKLQPNKTDANDAQLLAELARTGFYRSVAVKSEAAQPALRGGGLGADPGASGASLEGLGTPAEEAQRPQEGLRGAGP